MSSGSARVRQHSFSDVCSHFETSVEILEPVYSTLSFSLLSFKLTVATLVLFLFKKLAVALSVSEISPFALRVSSAGRIHFLQKVAAVCNFNFPMFSNMLVVLLKISSQVKTW